MTVKLKYMRDAITIAKISMDTNQGGPFGAVIVSRLTDCIVGQGWNQVTSSHDPTAHAEVMAIRKACMWLNTHSLEGCDIYTTCEPCPMCLGAIYWAHISNIYYCSTRHEAAAIGFDDNFIYEEISLHPLHRKIPAAQILKEKSNYLFDQWRNKTDKIEY